MNGADAVAGSLSVTMESDSLLCFLALVRLELFMISLQVWIFTLSVTLKAIGFGSWRGLTI